MLSFPRRHQSWDFQHRTVNFWGTADGKGLLCRIQVEVLQDHFGLHGDDGAWAQETFASHRRVIEAKAIEIHRAGTLEPDGSILLRSADF